MIDIVMDRLYGDDQKWELFHYRKDYATVAYSEVEIRLKWRVIYISIRCKTRGVRDEQGGQRLPSDAGAD